MRKAIKACTNLHVIQQIEHTPGLCAISWMVLKFMHPLIAFLMAFTPAWYDTAKIHLIEHTHGAGHGIS